VAAQFFLNGLSVGCLYALAALGIGLTYQTYGFFNFAYGALSALAAYVTYAMLFYFRAPAALAISAGVAAAILLGGLSHFVVFSPLRSRNANNLTLLLASVGLFVVMVGCLVLIFGEESKAMPGEQVGLGNAVLGVRVADSQIVIGGSSLVVFIGWWLAVTCTKPGLLLRAIASDEYMAKLHGVRTQSILLYGLLASSLILAFCGVLQAFDTGLSPAMGFEIFLAAVVVNVIGGRTVITNVVAAMFLGIIQQTAVWIMPNQWQAAVVFVILILFLLLRPKDLRGSFQSRTMV
jgi:branched-chain amino acid transport system permease protein